MTIFFIIKIEIYFRRFIAQKNLMAIIHANKHTFQILCIKSVTNCCIFSQLEKKTEGTLTKQQWLYVHIYNNLMVGYYIYYATNICVHVFFSHNTVCCSYHTRCCSYHILYAVDITLCAVNITLCAVLITLCAVLTKLCSVLIKLCAVFDQTMCCSYHIL